MDHDMADPGKLALDPIVDLFGNVMCLMQV
jgi:hypothetical protein